MIPTRDEMIEELNAELAGLRALIPDDDRLTGKTLTECVAAMAEAFSLKENPSRECLGLEAELYKACSMIEAQAVRLRDAERARAALINFRAAFANRGETTSLHKWNERLRAADDDAREALAGRDPRAEPKPSAVR